jgi:hypothetical protein
MAQLIDLGKLRFHFAGTWASGTTYERNDIVKYGGNVYVYTHTLKTTGNLPTDTAHWALMVEGFKFEGVFNTGTAYQIGDGVTHGGKVYISILDSTGQTPPNATYWSQFVDGIQYEGEYDNTTAYQKNDLVVYGPSVYMATQDTTGNIPTVTTHWSQFVEGVSPEGIYNNSTAYLPGDLVAYGPNIYRNKLESTGNIPTNTTYWEDYVSGTKFNGIFNPATTYYVNDVVTYGGNAYRALMETAANLPTSPTHFELVVEGFSYQGVWSSATAYLIGHSVNYGGALYKAIADTTGDNPNTVTGSWTRINGGINNRGNWVASTSYASDDVVAYGGNTFLSLEPHASGVDFPTDLASNKWQKFSSGVDYKGAWTTGTYYKVDDIVKDGISTYICLADHTSSNFATDVAATKWEFFARGATDVLPNVTAADTGSALTVASNGIDYAWISSGSNKVFYVAPHGVDNANSGKSLATPWASIKYATTQCGTDAVIYVKNGTYLEQLPIIVPDTVAIIGDSQRNVSVQPASGNDDSGTVLNSESTMFKMSNGSLLMGMTFKGMTGWVPAASPNQGSINQSTPKGIAVALNPASAITTKSPYILECSAIGSGMIGAYVDGTVHSSGNKSMLFHAYTCICDNGVGIWAANNSKVEAVSCFTYYAYFGYAADHGSKIRALNGNNSYGTWGTVSVGYDLGETASVGSVLGQRLDVTNLTGTFSAGDTLTGTTSGATAVITNVQESAGWIYVRDIVGTWQAAETFTSTGSGAGTIDSGALSDQGGNGSGYVYVVNGLTVQPEPGDSVTFTGDSTSYVVQSIGGTWASASSEIVIILAQEKPTTVSAGTVTTLRKNYSSVRLTGHDFLSIGTGGITTTNYPGTPTQPAAQGNEINEMFPGRVYYVSTDQDGNFRVGEYFRIEQATGIATLNASAFDLAGLTSLKLGSIGAQLGETINEFSSDVTLSGSSNAAVPTENAVKTYIDNTRVAKTGDAMTGVLAMGANKITQVADPTAAQDVTTKNYVDTALASSSANEIPFYDASISSTETFSSGMRFNIETLTIANGVTYTIGTNGFHYVIPAGGSFAMFNA